MDPLSVAASAAGLASLSLQVTQLAVKLHRDIKAYGPDGKVLRRLASIVSRTSRVTKQTRAILEHLDARTEEPLGSDLALEIHAALLGLEQSLTLVASEFDFIKGISPAKRTILVIQRKLKVELLDELETSLTEDLDMLKTFILIHGWAISLGSHPSPRPAIDSSPSILANIDADDCQPEEIAKVCKASDSQKLVVFKKRLVAKDKTYVSSMFLGEIRQRDTQLIPIGEKETLPTGTSSSIFIQLPFFARGIEFQYARTLYTPLTFALRPIHLMDPGTEDEVDHAMRDGKLLEIQQLLVSGRLSLYSTGHRILYGKRSLFYIAAEHSQSHICQWLLSQDSSGRLLAEPPGHSRISRSNRQKGLDEVVDMLLRKKSDAFDVKDVSFCATLSWDPGHILSCLESVTDLTADIQQEIAEDIWFRTMIKFASEEGPRGVDLETWGKVLQRLIPKDGDMSSLARSHPCRGRTILSVIACDGLCPYDSITRTEFYLDQLEIAGVDVAVYLEAERLMWQQYPRQYLSDHDREYPREMRFRRYKAWTVPYWTWAHCRDGPASQLLKEFYFHPSWRPDHSFAYTSSDSWRTFLTPYSPDALYIPAPVKDWWPLVVRPIYDWRPGQRPPKVIINNRDETGRDKKGINEACQKAYRLFHSRYDRRWERKHGGKRSKGKKDDVQDEPLAMPGAWAD